MIAPENFLKAPNWIKKKKQNKIKQKTNNCTWNDSGRWYMAATAGGRVAVWRYGGEGTWHLVKMVTRALQLAICTSPIIYLVCPVKFCISIVFYFSWEHYNIQEESITKVMQRFGWQTRCIIGDVQMVNMAIRRDRKDCSKGTYVHCCPTMLRPFGRG